LRDLHSIGKGVANPFRHVELDIDIGADAKDWSAVQATEKLKPVETELRRIEEMVQELVAEMDYLRSREQKLRDTNESTNNRVKWFAFSTMGMLVALGAWQVIYLRAYFRYVFEKAHLGIIGTNPFPDQSILFKRFLGHCDWCGMISGVVGIFSGVRSPCVVMAAGDRYIMTQRSDQSKSLFNITQPCEIDQICW
jgi:hypothetical protein